MAQFVVRNLEDSIKKKLQRRAKRHGHSMEEEIRDILRASVHREQEKQQGLGSEIASLFSPCGLDQDIPELRGFKLKRPRLTN